MAPYNLIFLGPTGHKNTKIHNDCAWSVTHSDEIWLDVVMYGPRGCSVKTANFFADEKHYVSLTSLEQLFHHSSSILSDRMWGHAQIIPHPRRPLIHVEVRGKYCPRHVRCNVWVWRRSENKHDEMVDHASTPEVVHGSCQCKGIE